MTPSQLVYVLLVVFRLSLGAAWSIGSGRCERLTKHSERLLPCPPLADRRAFLTAAAIALLPLPSYAKCTDIDSCREIGERKDAEDLAANPIVRLGDGLQYKVLRPGLGNQERITERSKVKIIYSISQANGSYMYSRGFGYNKIDAGDGTKVSDLGLDYLALQMGSKDIPVGVQKAMVGMKRGERRRIGCPAELGFETSDWNPQPTTFRGKQQIKDYQNVLYGRGSTQPPFPLGTIWDVEVLSIR